MPFVRRSWGATLTTLNPSCTGTAETPRAGGQKQGAARPCLSGTPGTPLGEAVGASTKDSDCCAGSWACCSGCVPVGADGDTPTSDSF